MDRSRSTQPPPALVSAFERFVSPINARAMARFVAQRAGEESTASAVLRHVEASAVFFVPADQRPAVLDAARRVLGLDVEGALQPARAPVLPKEPETRTVRVPIHGEADLNHARLAARQLCQQVGLQGFAAQKLVTAVSELARNVAKYAAPGTVELRDDAPARKLRAVVSDQGPGIADLQRVLSGTYRSKTGMGQGLVGTRKLVDELDIQTGPTGTTVTIAVKY